MGGGSIDSSGGGELSRSLFANGPSSVSIVLVRIEAELGRRIEAEDAACCEDVDGCGRSASSLSTISTARSLPFLLLDVTEERAAPPSSVAPSDRAREIRLQFFLGEEVVSECAGSEEFFDFPTRPMMLLRIVDLRERFGTSEEGSASSSVGGVGPVEVWLAEPAPEGELGALEIFCFDTVWPIWNQVPIDTGPGLVAMGK